MLMGWVTRGPWRYKRNYSFPSCLASSDLCHPFCWCTSKERGGERGIGSWHGLLLSRSSHSHLELPSQLHTLNHPGVVGQGFRARVDGSLQQLHMLGSYSFFPSLTHTCTPKILWEFSDLCLLASTGTKKPTDGQGEISKNNFYLPLPVQLVITPQ